MEEVGLIIMIIIENNIIPLPGFKAMNLFGLILFVRKGAKMSEKDMNHEEIHSKQWQELLYIGFILLYVIDFIMCFIQYPELHIAYKKICFEKEAYVNQSNLMYLYNRKRFSFLKYL